MSRPDFTYERVDQSNAELRWTGDPAKQIFIYRDGILFQGPFLLALASRVLTVPWDDSEPVSWEVQEETTPGNGSNSLVPPPPIRPLIRWSTEQDAEFYRLFHREGEGGVEADLVEVAESVGVDFQQEAVPEDLNGVGGVVGDGGVWHYFRVETVRSDGAISTRALWAGLVRDQPVEPTLIAVTGAAFSFTVEITP